MPYLNGKWQDDPIGPAPEYTEPPGLAAQQQGFSDNPHHWRVDRYLELGFTQVDAERLACVRDSVRLVDRHGEGKTWTFPLHWGKVAKWLELGASHELLVDLYA